MLDIGATNIEIVTRATEAFQRGDGDAAFEHFHEEPEWVIAREHPEARTLLGRVAIVAYLRDWEATLDDMRIEVDRFVDAGSGVVGVGMVCGTGIGSGADLEVPIAFLYTLTDGRIVRVEEYLNPGEALAAVGLAEWPGSG